jgi:hypothetical protein
MIQWRNFSNIQIRIGDRKVVNCADQIDSVYLSFQSHPFAIIPNWFDPIALIPPHHPYLNFFHDNSPIHPRHWLIFLSFRPKTTVNRFQKIPPTIRRDKVILIRATHMGKTSSVNRFIFEDYTLHTVSKTQPAFS